MPWELTVAMLAITGGAAVFVAWPLLTGRTQPEEFLGSEPHEPVLQQLMFRRDAIYAAMKELEFDRAMGNLSEEDFQQLLERYKRRALALLKQIDDAKAGRLRPGDLPDEDEEFDREPAAASGRRGRPAGEGAVDLDVEQEIEAFRKRSRTQAGGSRPAPGAPQATRPAGARPTTCPSCGQPARDPEAAFCSRCGAPLRPRGSARPAPRQRGGKTNGVKGD